MPSISLTSLDAIVEEFMEEWQVPGLAMAIVHEGRPVLIKAYGLRDVEAGLPVTTDTQFLLGNNTMSFTATGPWHVGGRWRPGLVQAGARIPP